MFFFTCADFDDYLGRNCKEEISSAQSKEALDAHFTQHKKFTLQIHQTEKKCMVSYCQGFPIEKITPGMVQKKVLEEM